MFLAVLAAWLRRLLCPKFPITLKSTLILALDQCPCVPCDRDSRAARVPLLLLPILYLHRFIRHFCSLGLWGSSGLSGTDTQQFQRRFTFRIYQKFAKSRRRGIVFEKSYRRSGNVLLLSDWFGSYGIADHYAHVAVVWSRRRGWCGFRHAVSARPLDHRTGEHGRYLRAFITEQIHRAMAY